MTNKWPFAINWLPESKFLSFILGSVVLGHFLVITEIPFIAADWVTGLPIPRYLVMVLIIFLYLLGGSFIDDLAFMILATPIFYPAVIKLGYDPIWFGIMVGITLMIGVIIPPVAISVFIVRNITGVPFGTIYRGVLPFLLSLGGGGTAAFHLPGHCYVSAEPSDGEVNSDLGSLLNGVRKNPLAMRNVLS